MVSKFLDSKVAFYNGNESDEDDDDDDDESYNKNNEQQQLPKGFVNSCSKMNSLILLQKLINNLDVFITVVEHTCWRCKPRFWKHGYFKKEPHLIDQPRACRIYLLCCIKSIFLPGNQFSLNRVCLESFIFEKQK